MDNLYFNKGLNHWQHHHLLLQQLQQQPQQYSHRHHYLSVLTVSVLYYNLYIGMVSKQHNTVVSILESLLRT